MDTPLIFPCEIHGKKVLWSNGDYFIASGNAANTYLTLWTANNVRVGMMDTTLINKIHPVTRIAESRAKVSSIHIEPKHRGRNLGQALYKTLLQWLPAEVSGIYSYLPDRINKKQIPAIYRKFDGYVVDMDHCYIDRDEEK